MRPGAEETITRKVTLPVNKGTQPLLGLPVKELEEKGAQIDFDLADGKSSGRLKIGPTNPIVRGFHQRGETPVPIVPIAATLRSKTDYVILVTRPKGETYASMGVKTGNEYNFDKWTVVKKEPNRANVPSFSTLEVQGATITFQPARKAVGRMHWD